MLFHSIEEILKYCDKEHVEFWKAIQLADCDERMAAEEDSYEEMCALWHVMQENLKAYEPDERSRSGLVGHEGGQMEAYVAAGDTLCGDFVGKVMTNALKMGCNNACMKRIIAAPTAGACGVLPAVLVTYYDEKIAPLAEHGKEAIRSEKEQRMVEAMYVAAGVGQVIARRASLAGASGGCQAEIGSASAMAAAAIVHIKGGSKEQMADAAAIAIKNLLGLVCDPVAGLVEVPCVKRNAAGAVNALTAADMVLAGIKSRIPADQVFDAMQEVGDKMDASLKETSLGGVAATPAGMEVADRLLAE